MTHEIDEKKLEISDTDITFEKTYNKDLYLSNTLMILKRLIFY